MYGMMGHMFGYGYPNNVDWWWMIGFGLLRTVLIIGIIVWIVKTIHKEKYRGTSSNAISVLRERFAAGEIDEDEYKKKLKVLSE
ncbi:putative membrane protein [Anaerosolibacter carboniphilus]|uniref:Putative membrane protein n=1 Tax=Anaerosolibacter carboniphilus TaxID=1417629 RepID=A0A841KPS8_9FIRM|nr:SHOCT domain-containing protein [Anaerosolibacter carboniphilus]MBB6215433.1 putative membrane protein [Anaerosolibacter carboniphilus]